MIDTLIKLALLFIMVLGCPVFMYYVAVNSKNMTLRDCIFVFTMILGCILVELMCIAGFAMMT